MKECNLMQLRTFYKRWIIIIIEQARNYLQGFIMEVPRFTKQDFSKDRIRYMGHLMAKTIISKKALNRISNLRFLKFGVSRMIS